MNKYDEAINKLNSYLNELLEEKELLVKSVYKNNKEAENYEWEIKKLENTIEECNKKLAKLVKYKQDKRTIRRGHIKKIGKILLIIALIIAAGLIANSVSSIMVNGFIDSTMVFLNDIYLIIGAIFSAGVIGIEAIGYFTDYYVLKKTHDSISEEKVRENIERCTREKIVLEDSKKKIEAKNVSAKEQLQSLCEKVNEIDESFYYFQDKRNEAIGKLVLDNESKLNSMYQERGLSLPVALSRKK